MGLITAGSQVMVFPKQAAWGIGDTPDTPTPVIGGGDASADVNIFKSARVNSDRTGNKPKRGKYHYVLPLNTELDPISCLPYLYNLFGKYTFQVDTPVAGANTHTFTFANTAAEYAVIHQKGMSIVAYDPIKGTSYEWDSCAVNSLDITTPDDTETPFIWEVFARDEVEGTSGQTYTPPVGNLIMDNYTATLDIGVLASEISIPLYDVNHNITRGLTMSTLKNVQTASRWNQSSETPIAVGGTFAISRTEATRAAIKSALDNGTEQSIIVAYTSPQFVTGTTPYSVIFAYKEAWHTLKTMEDVDGDEMDVYTFESGKESVDQNVVVTVINGEGTL